MEAAWTHRTWVCSSVQWVEALQAIGTRCATQVSGENLMDGAREPEQNKA